MTPKTINHTIYIIVLLLIIEQSNIVMLLPAPDRCINNCWGQYHLCVKIPQLTAKIQQQCLEEKRQCEEKCNEKLIDRLNVTVERL